MANLSFAQQMFGHVNSQEILSAMPEAATAQLALQSELEVLQQTGQTMMQEFESQQKQFQIDQENMNDAIRNTKLKELLIKKPIDEIFKQLGIKIMTTVGGSSGALFATLLIAMSTQTQTHLIISTLQETINCCFAQFVLQSLF